MSRFSEICQADINWRIDQIAMIKKSTALLSITNDMREVLRKYSVPAIYAIWEGFITSIFAEYVKIINREEIPIANIDKRIMTYYSFVTLNLASPPTKQEKKERFTAKMLEHFSDSVKLSSDIQTNANVDYESLSAIMYRYGLEPLPEKKYKSKMCKFLRFRNQIAHGDKAIAVDNDTVLEFSILVNDLMADVFISLETAISTRSYINKTL